METNELPPYVPQPVHEISYGNIKTTIWRRTIESKPVFTVSFQRYYQENGEKKTSSSFGQTDLLAISLMATRAFEWIATQADAPGL